LARIGRSSHVGEITGNELLESSGFAHKLEKPSHAEMVISRLETAVTVDAWKRWREELKAGQKLDFRVSFKRGNRAGRPCV
jgi:hypothetical protein